MTESGAGWNEDYTAEGRGQGTNDAFKGILGCGARYPLTSGEFGRFGGSFLEPGKG